MAVHDSIGDMLTKIRNAILARHFSVKVRYSQFNQNLVQIFCNEGFIRKFELVGEGVSKVIDISLVNREDVNGYIGQYQSSIHNLKRISKPGRRVYVAAKKIPRIMNGLAVVIVSTSKGLMTGKQARTSNLGGELVLDIMANV